MITRASSELSTANLQNTTIYKTNVSCCECATQFQVPPECNCSYHSYPLDTSGVQCIQQHNPGYASGTGHLHRCVSGEGGLDV